MLLLAWEDYQMALTQFPPFVTKSFKRLFFKSPMRVFPWRWRRKVSQPYKAESKTIPYDTQMLGRRISCSVDSLSTDMKDDYIK